MDDDKSVNPHFLQLVLSLQTSAMLHLGKMASPVSGKIERNLEMARNSIDTLDMLGVKTAGNLSREEKDFLDHVLYELRLNYVDEVKKDEAGKTASRDSGVTEPEPNQGQRSNQSQSQQEESGRPSSSDSGRE